MMKKATCLAGLLACGLICTMSAGPVLDKFWLFTTADSMIVDLKPIAGVELDLAATTLTLQRIDVSGEPFRIPLASTAIVPSSDIGVVRVYAGSLDVAVWAPRTPVLYQATLEVADAAGRRETVRQRIGFRSFETREGRLWLNGRPIFLRGLAINPPGRGIPRELEHSRAFAEDYVRFMLRHHVNIIRIPDDETWYNVCDELGMMVFGGNYSGNALGKEDPAVDEVDAKGPPKDRDSAARWYRETKFHPISHHPSLLIYALTNETPYAGPLGDAWHAFLIEMYGRLQRWDPTRLYIANAGYGLGRTGDICDLHRYWGWYYSSPFTFLHLRDAPVVTMPEKVQPLTFTECVGSYGGPDGRVNLSPNHKNPISQQSWTGHAASRDQAQLFHAHQAFNFRQATELFRRLRPLNSELSGVFPFTILFHDWHTVSDFDEMQPRPVTRQMLASYAPVLLSWELNTTQVYVGTELKPIIHLVNDADDFSDLRDATVRYELRDGAETAHAAGQFTVALLPYYGTARHPVSVRIPQHLPTGTYRLVATLEQSGRTLTENRIEVFVASPAYARTGVLPNTPIRLFDPTGETRRALAGLGLPHVELAPDLAGSGPIVIGEGAIARLSDEQAVRVRAFAESGGRVLVLRQTSADAAALNRVLPARVRLPSMDLDDPNYPPPPRPSYQGMNINPERAEHPVFAGLDRLRLQTWSDYTGWDETKPGLPAIYPVTGTFLLEDKADVGKTAVLANHSVGLEGLSLAEFFVGRGSVILSGFDVARRAGLDPVADRLLSNLVSYTSVAAGHEAHVLIEAPIIWGEYDTERGVLTGINSGLMLNSRPALTGRYRSVKIAVHKDGHQFAGGPGGWNTRPGIQYVPYGRRPFGPYVHGGWSGTPLPLDGKNPLGEGRFWCRIPSGKQKVTHRVFNPAAEPLEVRLSANGRETVVSLAPEETRAIDVALVPGTLTVENTIRGDRRLVLLETSFH